MPKDSGRAAKRKISLALDNFEGSTERLRAATMAKAVAVADEQTGMERFKSQPQRAMDFLKDVRAEMRKVITPTRAEVQSTTLVVIGCVFIFAAYFAIVDFVVGQGVTQLIQHFAKH